MHCNFPPLPAARGLSLGSLCVCLSCLQQFLIDTIVSPVLLLPVFIPLFVVTFYL